MRPDIVHQKLVALFILGCVLFNYPLLSLFNLPTTLFGIPALYVYIFAAWGAVIGLLAWTIERAHARRTDSAGRD